MKLLVHPADSLKGTAFAPPSKSYTHRATFLASLTEGTTSIEAPLISADTRATIDFCKKIGAKIQQEIKRADARVPCRASARREGRLIVTGVGDKLKCPGNVNAENSGTTIRIATAISALAKGKTTLTGDESLKKRPMGPIIECLNKAGIKASATDGKPPITIESSGLEGGELSISGEVSSQFISGLLIALPLAKKDSVLKIEGELKSKPYVEMTLDLMKKFGVEIENKDLKDFIIRRQVYKTPKSYTVEGDYSSSSYMLAAGALVKGSSISVKNLFRDSKQGDKKLVEILKQMGAKVFEVTDAVTVGYAGRLNGIEVDLSDTPDLVPTVAVLGALAKGKTLIKNVAHARFKETDRIHAPFVELTKMGAKITEKQDGLEMDGVERLKGAKVHGYDDHRMVMSLALAGLCADGETEIDTAESLDVSFPNFAEVFKKLGAKMELVG